MQVLYKNLDKRMMFFFIVLVILYSSIVYSREYTQDYNNPLSKSMTDSWYCLRNGDCSFNNLLLYGNFTLYGDSFNATVTYINYNVTGLFTIAGDMVANSFNGSWNGSKDYVKNYTDGGYQVIADNITSGNSYWVDNTFYGDNVERQNFYNDLGTATDGYKAIYSFSRYPPGGGSAGYNVRYKVSGGAVTESQIYAPGSIDLGLAVFGGGGALNGILISNADYSSWFRGGTKMDDNICSYYGTSDDSSICLDTLRGRFQIDPDEIGSRPLFIDSGLAFGEELSIGGIGYTALINSSTKSSFAGGKAYEQGSDSRILSYGTTLNYGWVYGNDPDINLAAKALTYGNGSVMFSNVLSTIDDGGAISYLDGDGSFMVCKTVGGLCNLTGDSSGAFGEDIQLKADNSYLFGKNSENDIDDRFCIGYDGLDFCISDGLINATADIYHSQDTHTLDNIRHYFGNDDDSSIYYDGSDLIINPDFLGAGNRPLNIIGKVNISISATIGKDTIDAPPLTLVNYADEPSEAIYFKNWDLAAGGDVMLKNNYYEPYGASTFPFWELTNAVYMGKIASPEIMVYGASANSYFRIYNADAAKGINVTIGEIGDNSRFTVNGLINIPDNYKFLLGSAEDSSIYYDGKDLNMNPKEVGTGQLKVLGMINNSGYNITTNNIYGEIFYFNTTATTLSFAQQGRYYQMFLPNATHLNGFSRTVTNMTAQIKGLYACDYTLIGSGQNNHIYISYLVRDMENMTNCVDMQKMTAGGDIVEMRGSCYVDLDVDDVISVYVGDSSGTGAGEYYGGNLRCIRAGD